MQNYTDNANGDVPLTVENVWYLERTINFIWSIVFFIKTFYWVFYFKISFYDNNINDELITRDHIRKCDEWKYSSHQIMVVLKITFKRF